MIEQLSLTHFVHSNRSMNRSQWWRNVKKKHTYFFPLLSGFSASAGDSTKQQFANRNIAYCCENDKFFPRPVKVTGTLGWQRRIGRKQILIIIFFSLSSRGNIRQFNSPIFPGIRENRKTQDRSLLPLNRTKTRESLQNSNFTKNYEIIPDFSSDSHMTLKLLL